MLWSTVYFWQRNPKTRRIITYLYFLYIPLFNLIFMHLNVPIHTTHKRTSTEDWTQDKMPWGDRRCFLSCTQLPHNSVMAPTPGYAMWLAAGLLGNPNPLLWEGRSQQRLLRPHLPCALESHCTLSSAPAYNTEVRYSRNRSQSVSQAILSSAGFV